MAGRKDFRAASTVQSDVHVREGKGNHNQSSRRPVTASTQVGADYFYRRMGSIYRKCEHRRVCAMQVLYFSTERARQQAFGNSPGCNAWNCNFEDSGVPTVHHEDGTNRYFLRMPDFERFEEELFRKKTLDN